MTTKVHFVCIHNSARSQMAEAFLKHHGAGRFEAQSAGIEPGMLEPVVVEVMRECGIGIANNPTRSVVEVLAGGGIFEYVITVCDEARAERFPVVPGATKRVHWGFPDPSAVPGSPEAKRQRTREIRDEIQKTVLQWCATVCSAPASPGCHPCVL